MDSIIAKNLLEGNTCDKCIYMEHEPVDIFFCSYNSGKGYNNTKPLPKEKTCKHFTSVHTLKWKNDILK